MPYKAKKPCAYPGCAKLATGRYCEEHQKQEAKRYNRYDRDPDSNKRYGRTWKQIRAAFLSANPRFCQITGYGGTTGIAEAGEDVDAVLRAMREDSGGCCC